MCICLYMYIHTYIFLHHKFTWVYKTQKIQTWCRCTTAAIKVLHKSQRLVCLFARTPLLPLAAHLFLAVCKVTNSYMWHVHVCDVTYSNRWRDSCVLVSAVHLFVVCVTIFAHMRDVASLCVWHDIFIWVAWHIHISGMTHTSLCATWRVHTCNRTCSWGVHMCSVGNIDMPLHHTMASFCETRHSMDVFIDIYMNIDMYIWIYI